MTIHDAPTTRGHHSRRDRGVTLVELVLAVALSTIVVTAVSAAVIALITNDRTVQSRIGDAQDIRQLVNYLPLDVRATEVDGVKFAGETGFEEAASCTNDGTLRLELTSTDGLERVEYRTRGEDGSQFLHRVSCTRASTDQAFGSPRWIRMADRLDDANPVSVTWATDAVDGRQVRMVLHQELLGDTALFASPFDPDDSLDHLIPPPPPPPPPPDPSDPGPIGVCPPNPNTQRDGFMVMTAGDVEFHNSANESYGGVAVGGDLTFKNYRLATQQPSQFTVPGMGQPAGLLVGGMVNWPDSGGGYLDIERGYLHVGDIANWAPHAGGPSNQLRLSATSGPQNRQLRVNNTDERYEWVEQPGVFGFAQRFQALRSISSGLQTLPGGCEGVTDLELRGQNGVGEWSGGNVWLYFEPGMATVLTMTMAEYASIGNVNLASGSAQPGQNTPLIINITDSGSVTMPSGETNISRNHVPYVLWNFPNASRVTTTGTFWGAILAPNAHVVQGGDIRGNVMAASMESTGGIISNQAFQGTFPWPA